jgi:hypothetical protein
VSETRVGSLVGRVDDLVVRALQAVILAILLFGIATRDSTIIVNGVLSLAVTQMPTVLNGNQRRTVDTTLVLWITLAALVHAVGTLGPYGTVPWWDNLAHALSASVVAAVGYTGARALDVRDECLRLPATFLFVYVLLFVLTAGVVWEVFEFSLAALASALDLPPPLGQHGLPDTVSDLVYDALGGFVVAAGAVLYTRVLGR